MRNYHRILTMSLAFAACVAAGRMAWSADAKERFSAERLDVLRRKASAFQEFDTREPDGWSVGKLDAKSFVSVFEPLRIKNGVVLRSYVFREGGNGNGVVWALPADAEFPSPDRCPKGKFLPDIHMPVPRPPAAFASVMAQIEGDGSPWSYLAASLLRRELQEYGAMWHGQKWSTHKILDSDPLRDVDRERAADADPMMTPRGPRSEWKWLGKRPDDWRPRVEIAGERVTVTFYTYSGWERQRVFSHTDRFSVGNYDAESETSELAKGPGGFLF
jgi:hypothetical protein